MELVKKTIEIGSFHDPGFDMIACGGDWKVSVLNGLPRFYHGHLDYVERHSESDEVFILTEGKARLFVVGSGDEPDRIPEIYPMEHGKAYNIKKNVWHAVEVNAGTRILVIERTDTDDSNTIHFSYSFPNEKRQS